MSDAPMPVGRYRELVQTELPARARAEGWVLTDDHCFGRVLLDHATGGCWYDTLDRRSRVPAREQLDPDQLARAVELGERLLVEGDPLLRELDARSLAWRGKPAKRRAGNALDHRDRHLTGSPDALCPAPARGGQDLR